MLKNKMAALKLAAVLLFLVSLVYSMEVNQKEQLSVGTFAFAKQFQDHMVLQRSPAKATIYGFASDSDVGQHVTVTLTIPRESYQYEYHATVTAGASDGSGQWLVTLDPVDAGTPVSITATMAGTILTLDDVIFGDVWLCSGQSNMEFTVNMMNGGDAEIADAHNYPDIRVMTVANTASATPNDDLTQITENWSRASASSINGGDYTYFSAVCWVYGKTIYKARNYPIGLISVDWGGTPAEAWSSPDALASCVPGFVDSLPAEPQKYDNSALWNSMIYPLTKMTIYGAIWYQGEADAYGAPMDRYNCTFPAMIKDWRQKFSSRSGQTSDIFPFGFVQLAPNAPGEGKTMGFIDIRWHQTADHGYVPNPHMPNTFMAVTHDLPDFDSPYGSIHPRDKLDVGERLALAGRAIAYGESVMFQGPFPQKIKITCDNGVLIDYGDQWTLDIRDSAGFEVGCANPWTTAWKAAPIASNDQTTITLQATQCNQDETLSQVRYAWNESPCEFKKCAVYSTVNGLPAGPFVLSTTSVNEKGEPYFLPHVTS